MKRFRPVGMPGEDSEWFLWVTEIPEFHFAVISARDDLMGLVRVVVKVTDCQGVSLLDGKGLSTDLNKKNNV